MAPMAEKKPAEEKKAVKAPAERKPTSPLLPEIRKRKKKSVVTYKICIFTVLKQIHPDIGISSKAMGIMKL